MIRRICWVIQACLVARLAESGDLVVTNVCQEIYHYKSIHISLSVNLANLTQKTPSFSIWANLYYISLFNFFSIVLKYYYFPSPHNFAHSHQPFPYFPQKNFPYFPQISQFSLQKQTSTSFIDAPQTHLFHWQSTHPRHSSSGTQKSTNQPLIHGILTHRNENSTQHPRLLRQQHHTHDNNNNTIKTHNQTYSKPTIKPIQNPHQNPQFLHSTRLTPLKIHNTRSASKPTSLLQINSDWLRHDHPSQLLHSTSSTPLKTHSSSIAPDWHQNPRVCSRSGVKLRSNAKLRERWSEREREKK